MTDVLNSLLTRSPLAVTDGIPRFVDTEDESQLQTAQSFGFKWARRDSYESPGMRQSALAWLLERYGFDDAAQMREHFADTEVILDAGCGSAFSSSLWLQPGWSRGSAQWIGADISTAVDVARERLAGIENAHFLQADILNLPFHAGAFGGIFCEGALHHMPSVRHGLHALAAFLRPGGELAFYVYRRKAPVREFVDDYVRERISSMPAEEAWEELRPLTQLGRVLAELDVDVDVPDVPVLGIRAGRYDVQRLIYWHFAKLFWNEALSFEENLHVNFDWYHPKYAHRHTEEELRSWCAEARLEIVRFHDDPSGFTLRAVRS